MGRDRFRPEGSSSAGECQGGREDRAAGGTLERMTILCLDIGRSRIGVALSDPGGTLARPHAVLPAPGGRLTAIRGTGGAAALVRRLQPLVEEFEVGEIVVGLPRRLGGEHGPEAAAVTRLAEELAELTEMPVRLWDERLSTVEATRILRERGVRGRRLKALVDQVAAAVILQSYLDHRTTAEERS